MEEELFEEAKKIELSTCPEHNLKYDPKVTWGCVLCRKSQKKRISGYLVVGIPLFVGLVFYLYFGNFYAPDEELNLNIHQGVAATASTVDVPCHSKVYKRVESCFKKLATEAKELDRQMCLAELESLATTCPDAYSPEKGTQAPLYSVGQTPEWDLVRTAFDKAQLEIEDCMESSTYNFAMRLHADPGSEEKKFTMSLFGIEPKHRVCLDDLLNGFDIPGTMNGYSVVFFVDSKMLSLHRPEQKDTRKEEYEAFAKQQRDNMENKRLKEDRLREIQQRNISAAGSSSND